MYEYKRFPDKFNKEFLIDLKNLTLVESGFDEYLDISKKYRYYVEHFFQLNEWLKFSFRYYYKLNEISNIYIQDVEGCNEYFEFYDFKILNDIKNAFNIENQTFDWSFSFEEYVN